ncbi:hypothetical protein BCR44DRAFT_1178581 [Catenaria anguillulae PL171]|uniref:Uncharacterized protein n=1 Tax=Catenaria anguillulae PL171 TaxID=765915 RepID=A0A1Y2HJU4_9FUNG|nr:hypothetical protein BCR44DRAFT_1178581 [Catenaria anguillulae PL171]
MFSLSGMDPTSIALTLDQFIDGLRNKVVLHAVVDWLHQKCVAGTSSDTETDIDPLTDREWVLLVAIGCVPLVGEKKMRELAFANIKAGRLTPAVVSRVMVKHTPAFESKHKILLALVDALMSPSLASFQGGFGGGFGGTSTAVSSGGGSSRAPKAAALVPAGTASSSGSAQDSGLSDNVLSMLNPPVLAHAPTAVMAVGAQLLYSGIAHLTIASRQDWVAKCVELIARGGPHAHVQTDLAIRVLLAVASSPRAIATQLEPFIVFVRSKFDELSALPLYHVSMYFDIAARIGFASVSTLDSVASPLIADLELLARKFLTITQPRPNAMGVLAALAMVERYADPRAPWMLPPVPTEAGQDVSAQQLEWQQQQQQAAIALAKERLVGVLECAHGKPVVLTVMFERLARVIADGGLHQDVIDLFFIDRQGIVEMCLQQDSGAHGSLASSSTSTAQAAGLVFAVTMAPSGEAVVVDSVALQSESSSSSSVSQFHDDDVELLTNETDRDPNHRLDFTSNVAKHSLPCFDAFPPLPSATQTSKSARFSTTGIPLHSLFACARACGPRLLARRLQRACVHAKNGGSAALDQLIAHMKKIKAVEAFLFAQHQEQCALYETAQAKAKELQAVASQAAAAAAGNKGKASPRDRAATRQRSVVECPRWTRRARVMVPISTKPVLPRGCQPSAPNGHCHQSCTRPWRAFPSRTASYFTTCSSTFTIGCSRLAAQSVVYFRVRNRARGPDRCRQQGTHGHSNATTECPLPVYVATELAACWLTWFVRLTQAREDGGSDEVKDEPKEVRTETRSWAETETRPWTPFRHRQQVGAGRLVCVR